MSETSRNIFIGIINDKLAAGQIPSAGSPAGKDYLDSKPSGAGLGGVAGYGMQGGRSFDFNSAEWQRMPVEDRVKALDPQDDRPVIRRKPGAWKKHKGGPAVNPRKRGGSWRSPKSWNDFYESDMLLDDPVWATETDSLASYAGPDLLRFCDKTAESQVVDDELEKAYRMRDEALSEAKVPFAKYLYRSYPQSAPMGNTHNKWRKAQNIINKKLGSKKHYLTYDELGY